MVKVNKSHKISAQLETDQKLFKLKSAAGQIDPPVWIGLKVKTFAFFRFLFAILQKCMPLTGINAKVLP